MHKFDACVKTKENWNRISMKSIKIIRIIDRLNIGGPAIHCILLTSRIHGEEFQAGLITGKVCDFEGDMGYLAEKEGVSPYYIEDLGRKISFFSDIRAFWKIFKILYREKPDIVHTHKSKAGILGRLAAFILRVPVIFHTFHGHIFHGYFSKAKSLLFIQLERILAFFTTKIFVISQKQYEEICFTYRIAPSSKFVIVPLGFDFTCFENPSCSKEIMRKEWGLSPEDRAIGIVARLTPIKNHTMFLKAAQQVLAQRERVKFFIIGDGEEKENLQEQAKALEISNSIIFTGWIEDRSRIYQALDIVALTSQNEGTPVTLIEALFCSKAVVATKVGGVADVVQDKRNGLLVEKEDIDSLARSFLYLLDNPEECRRMGENGREEMENRYSAKRLLGDIEKIYRNAMQK